MSKQNFLFIVIGLLIGFVGGFAFANGVNRRQIADQTRAAAPATSSAQATASGGAPAQGVMPPEVREALDHAKNEPDNFEAQVQAAQMYYTIQRYEPALTYLQRAHELRPDDYDVIVRLGNANFYLERYDQAGDWYAKATAMRPDDAGARTDLGLTFYLRGDIDRAITEYRSSLALDTKHQEALQNLTVALRDKKMLAEAKQTLARLEAAHPQNASIERLRQSLARD